MRRRDLIISIVCAATAWPLMARAQQVAVPLIGFLNGQSAETWADLSDAFRKGLSESSYTEGRNLRIEFHFAQNRSDRLPGLAADLIKRPVQVIVASGGDVAARAAKAATSTIPIVATFGGDPVESGLVASFNRPGGNVTGVSLFNLELVGKQMEVLHRALPGVTRVAILLNDKNPNATRMLRAAEAAAPALAVDLLTLTAENDGGMDNAFGAVSQRAAGALIIVGDPLFHARRGQLVALAARHRIPTMYFGREFPEVGGLMSYASNRMEDYRQLGVYAAKILNGTKPADLPVVQPTKLEFVINLKTAKTLGLTFPPGLIAIADEVIE